MPKTPAHVLIWSAENQCYFLHTSVHPPQSITPGNEDVWRAWLTTHSSFSFQGQHGHLNVLKEFRPRGTGYWYAYHTSQGRTHKRYLGRTETLRISRLEETARMLLREQEPVLALDQGMLVLSSRLAPPRLPNALVERERLLTVLNGALATSLMLVSAPAGFGKTTLLATWARRRKTQIAWLSLDELDNSPTRFWVALIVALRRCPSLTSSFGETVLALLQSPQTPPLSSCLSALLQELESCEVHPAPIVLIVDDYQVIEEPTIHQGMTFFLEHLPIHLHLILASRVDPDLPLSRLRVRGQLSEIRMEELCFGEGEASQYLGQMLSPQLSAEEVRRLLSRTEGWIAGLQLAALTMQKREDRAAFLQAFTGSQRYLLDYVQEEILARLPASVRDFLLHSAILSHLDASVCQAVNAAPTQAASQQMLAFLERANLFLVPLDEEQCSYSLHGLFREALLAVLHTSQPELVPLLHCRAADFYEAQGKWHEAIAHQLEARDFSAATRLMKQTVEQFGVRGEAATMARWALALPEHVVREHARLVLTAALYRLATGYSTAEAQRARIHSEVRQFMARIETALLPPADKVDQEIVSTGTGTALSSGDREIPATEEALLRRRLRLLHLYLVLNEAVTSGEFERVSRMQQEVEEELDQDEEAIWQTVPLVCNFLLHYILWHEGASLVPRLLIARERMSRSGSLFASLKVRQWLVQTAVRAGQLGLALQESQAALDLIEQITGYTLLKGYFEDILAQVWYQRNRLQEARDLLHAAVHDAAAWQQIDLLGWGYIELLRVALARGEWSLAEFALHEMELLVQRERFRFHTDWLPVLRANFWLAQGYLEAASDWAAGVVFPQGAWEESVYGAFPVVIRVHFAQRNFQEAAALLERWKEHLDRPANIGITITYLAQLLVALHQTGQGEQAHVVAARLFALTEPEGYLRVYVDESEPMREALLALLTSRSQQHELAPSTTAYVAKLLASFEQEKPGENSSPVAALALAPAPSPARQALAISPTPGVSLTRREQEVLRLLAAGASNQEIAQTLVISLDTVKKHVSNLLGKLGVISRIQAVAQARARSLI